MIKPMTPNIEQSAQKLAEELLGPEKLFAGTVFQEALAIITHHLTTHTKDLETRLAYAEDAAAKGDLARQNAAGMEMQIKELKDENKRLREAIAETLSDNAHLADGNNCTLRKLKQALTKPT